MADKKRNGTSEQAVDLKKIYSLLGALKNSVDRLSVQVKALRNEKEGSVDE